MVGAQCGREHGRELARGAEDCPVLSRQHPLERLRRATGDAARRPERWRRRLTSQLGWGRRRHRRRRRRLLACSRLRRLGTTCLGHLCQRNQPANQDWTAADAADIEQPGRSAGGTCVGG
jgi:hypothetical protein